MVHIGSFYEQLSSIISKYSDNLLEFSQGTQCSKTTLWRWLNSINLGLPDPNKLLSALEKDSGLRGKKKIVDYYGGEIQKYLIKSFPLFFCENLDTNEESGKVNEITDFYSFVIANICGTLSGASEMDITDLVANVAARKSGFEKDDLTPELISAHGKISRSKIQLLLDDGIIFKDHSDKYHLHKKGIDIVSSHSGAHLGEMLSSFIKPEEMELGLNSMFFTIESVTEEAAKEVAKMQRESFMKCYNIMEKNKSSDGIPISIVNFSERFQFSPLNIEGGL